MSDEEGSFGLNAVEKILGFVILVVGILAAYYTYSSFQALSNFAGFFTLLSVILILLGLFLLIAKTTE